MILPSTNATFSPSLLSDKPPLEERFQRGPVSQSQWPPGPKRDSAPPTSFSRCDRAAQSDRPSVRCRVRSNSLRTRSAHTFPCHSVRAARSPNRVTRARPVSVTPIRSEGNDHPSSFKAVKIVTARSADRMALRFQFPAETQRKFGRQLFISARKDLFERALFR